eukprot:3246890-Prymnesium_polylepis.2
MSICGCETLCVPCHSSMSEHQLRTSAESRIDERRTAASLVRRSSSKATSTTEWRKKRVRNAGCPLRKASIAPSTGWRRCGPRSAIDCKKARACSARASPPPAARGPSWSSRSK